MSTAIQGMQHGNRLLFVPVSGPRGMGEYARCLVVATAMARRRADLVIHFALSRAAPQAATAPFPATLLPASPTFHTREVCALIGDFRPDVVVFDNAGRTRQLRAAHAAGARVIFVSSRPRQRRKAFRLRWMGLIDEHWIAWPEFMAGSLTPVERLKLRLRRRPRLRFVVCNGGDTLLQTLACGRACVAVPIAGDQAHRIARCVRAGLALPAALDARSIEQTAVSLLEAEPLRAGIEQRLRRRPVRNCMDEVLAALEALLG